MLLTLLYCLSHCNCLLNDKLTNVLRHTLFLSKRCHKIVSFLKRTITLEAISSHLHQTVSDATVKQIGSGGGTRTLDLRGYEPDELPLLHPAVKFGSP